MSTIETFLTSLQQYEGDGVYNPWRDYDERCDCGPDAPLIRSRQLTDYLLSGHKIMGFGVALVGKLSGQKYPAVFIQFLRHGNGAQKSPFLF